MTPLYARRIVPAEEIEALRRDLDTAARALLSASEEGLALMRRSPLDEQAVAGVLERILCACGFHDIAGQRLDRLEAGLEGGEASPPSDADGWLLNGPALPGQGLDQSAADALFGKS